ncbi:hypothetical protein BMQ_1077 [Priestia megaterium QM B1551]|uniref:Uncharacterized protein n=1 Tax=Priestia megaterium (strain ATCC 12872 / QMB1551) TaxID=545693 RepID=D5DY28_PRIM1|nr:hypothetical protein BMQ_1077 [Priestia megaterium QM B1551]
MKEEEEYAYDFLGNSMTLFGFFPFFYEINIFSTNSLN